MSRPAVDALLRTHRDQILAIAERHGASNVRVFGSVARGEARPDSDVDILVDLELGRSLFDHAQLQIDLEALLGRKVDVVSARGLRSHLRDRVLQEAIPLRGTTELDSKTSSGRLRPSRAMRSAAERHSTAMSPHLYRRGGRPALTSVARPSSRGSLATGHRNAQRPRPRVLRDGSRGGVGDR
jgi:hypothetical protein